MYSFNCQEVTNESRLCELEKAIVKLNFDIVGLAEIRRVGEEFSNGKMGSFYIIWGKPKVVRGVSFYLHRKWAKRIIVKIEGNLESTAFVKIAINMATYSYKPD